LTGLRAREISSNEAAPAGDEIETISVQRWF
jgi:hypothetical protein